MSELIKRQFQEKKTKNNAFNGVENRLRSSQICLLTATNSLYYTALEFGRPVIQASRRHIEGLQRECARELYSLVLLTQLDAGPHNQLQTLLLSISDTVGVLYDLKNALVYLSINLFKIIGLHGTENRQNLPYKRDKTALLNRTPS